MPSQSLSHEILSTKRVISGSWKILKDFHERNKALAQLIPPGNLDGCYSFLPLHLLMWLLMKRHAITWTSPSNTYGSLSKGWTSLERDKESRHEVPRCCWRWSWWGRWQRKTSSSSPSHCPSDLVYRQVSLFGWSFFSQSIPFRVNKVLEGNKGLPEVRETIHKKQRKFLGIIIV